MASIQSTSPPPADSEECGICLESLKNPVCLPCGHKFCDTCFEGWRSKYDHRASGRTCPKCRRSLPPTKEMLSQLRGMRAAVANYEKRNQTTTIYDRMSMEAHLEYLSLKALVKEMEDEIGDTDQVLEDGDDFVVLPHSLTYAAGANDILTILEWLGGPIPARLNAKDPEKMHRTLLHEAVFEGHSSLISILLQFGADVDPRSAHGRTPFMQACDFPRLESVARLLLEWGANKAESLSDEAKSRQTKKIARLLESDLGGRRCEIFGLEARKDLNGKTAVAEKYIPGKDRYKMVMEETEEMFLLSAKHLKRRDRTPSDCGYYLQFEGRGEMGNNKISTYRIRTFASKEEIEAFKAAEAQVAADTEDEKPATSAAAEATAEESAALLVTELDNEEAKCSAKNGKE